MDNRIIYVVSDSVGETAELVVKPRSASLTAQPMIRISEEYLMWKISAH